MSQGNYDGDEVVQLYVNTTDSTVPAPHIRLVSFDRIPIRVGETAKVNFIIEPKWHAVVYDSQDICCYFVDLKLLINCTICYKSL